jgi:hypothetical protein
MTLTQQITEIVPTKTAKLYLIPTPDSEFGPEWFHPKFSPMPSPLSDLPDSYTWSKSFVIAVLEVWAGRRSVMQLAKNSHRSVLSKITSQGKTLNEVCQIRRIYINQPIEGVIETTVTLSIKNRVRSLILRFEGIDKKWICTELRLL